MTHGIRATYERGCRCTPCRAANARYWSHWFHARKSGKPLLGSRVNAARTHILMKVIRTEGISHGALDQDLAWWGHYSRVRNARTVTLRTALKVARYYRLRVADGQPPLPLDDSLAAS